MDETSEPRPRPRRRASPYPGDETPPEPVDPRLAQTEAEVRYLRDELHALETKLQSYREMEELRRSGAWTVLAGVALLAAGSYCLIEALDLDFRSMLLPIAAFLIGAGLRLIGSDRLDALGNKLLGRRFRYRRDYEQLP